MRVFIRALALVAAAPTAIADGPMRNRQRASGFVYESKDLLALTAFISYQARGLPMNVAIDGPATQIYERGKTFFNVRRGQLNLSCANCHERHAGGHLRAEPITQGQGNSAITESPTC